jgi:hypothetical protein
VAVVDIIYNPLEKMAAQAVAKEWTAQADLVLEFQDKVMTADLVVKAAVAVAAQVRSVLHQQQDQIQVVTVAMD